MNTIIKINYKKYKYNINIEIDIYLYYFVMWRIIYYCKLSNY